MRRIVLRCAAVLAVGALLACGSGTSEPDADDALPRLGRYAYEMSVPAGITTTTMRTFTGTLVLTFISRDSLAGFWDVPSSRYSTGSTAGGYQSRLALGFFNGGGWYFFAYPAEGGTVQHRLFPGRQPRCEGAALYSNSGSSSGVTRRDGTCVVSYVGLQ